MSIYDILLNIVVVSIPEEIIMTFIALLGLRRFDYFDKYNVKSTFKNVFIKVVVPSSLLFTITLYGLELNIYIRSVINILGFYIFMMFLLKEESKFRVFASTLAAFLLIVLMEIAWVIVLVYVFKMDPLLLSTNALNNLAICAPSRVLQFGVLYMVYINKNSMSRMGAYELWNNNRLFRKFTIFHAIFNIFVSVYIYNNFAINRCLINIPWENQLSIVTVISLIFVVEIIMPWIIMYIIYISGRRKSFN